MNHNDSGNREAREIGEFFDRLTDDYNSTIERCFPRYREMLWALTDYLPPQEAVHSILELGCGTGNLTVALHAKYPNAHVTTVDLSEESLNVCRSRLNDASHLSVQQADFRELRFSESQFDLIASSISLHHLTSEEKQNLYREIYGWLREGGTFANADQFRGDSDALYRQHIQNWKRLTFSAGCSDEEWEMWMKHQREHDHHEPLLDHFRWLETAGFRSVDCVWRYLLWSVVQARK